MAKKLNITQIEPLEIKYVLKCIEGLFKNRFLYVTTHKEGEVIGGGDAKQHGLTLQIEGVGLADSHCKLKFNGFKKFMVKDLGASSGTWLKIPKDGIAIKHNDMFVLDKWKIKFELGAVIPEIEELCSYYGEDALADLLLYNKITRIVDLYRVNYEGYKSYPFSD